MKTGTRMAIQEQIYSPGVILNKIKDQPSNMNRIQSQGKLDPRNTFQIRPLRRNCNSQPAKVYFLVAPKQRPSSKPIRSTSVIPLFNRDKLHYTPCFLGVRQLRKVEELQFLQSHEEKVQQNLKEIPYQEILLPKPRKGASKYCSVCQREYEDYLQHIESFRHKVRLIETPYSRHILELVDVARTSPPSSTHGVVTRSNKKRTPLPSDLLEDEELFKRVLVSGETRSISLRTSSKDISQRISQNQRKQIPQRRPIQRRN